MKNRNGNGYKKQQGWMYHLAVTILLLFWCFVCVGIEAMQIFPFAGVTIFSAGVGLCYLLKKIPANLRPRNPPHLRESIIPLPDCGDVPETFSRHVQSQNRTRRWK